MKRTYFLASLLGAFLMFPHIVDAQTYGVTTEASEQNTPSGWTAVALPKLPTITSANTFMITDYGASTSSADNTDAIQKACNAVTSNGGVVVIPAGTWMCGKIRLKSKTILHLAKGATLKLLDYNAYQAKYNNDGHNFIENNSNASDIVIEGEDSATCVIDGQGADWWKLRDSGNSAWDNLKRGSLIRFTSGSRFLVKGIKFLNAPGTNCTLGQSGRGSDFTVHDIQIIAPASTVEYMPSRNQYPSHNTDGIPMWAPYINVYNCYISNGDDNVVVDSNGRFVHVWNCVFGTGHGASIGSFTSNVHDVIYEGITFNKTEAGFKIKSARDRSGSVYNIIFRNSTLNGVLGNNIGLDGWYGQKFDSPSDAKAADSTNLTPYYHDILIQNITASGTPYNKRNYDYFPIYIFGMPESYVSNVTFDNVNISCGKKMFLANCRGIKFVKGCKINGTTISSVDDVNKLIATKYNAFYSVVEESITPTPTPDPNPKYDEKSVAISSATNTGTNTTSTWNFNDCYSVSNSKGKGYSAGKEDGVKYSSGVQFTLNLPAGIAVDSIAFSGYDNYTGADSYISELNGTEYGATDYVFPQKDASGAYVLTKHVVKLSEPAASALTFTFGGKQVVMAMNLYVHETTTGIKGLHSNGLETVNDAAWYTLSGQRVSKDSLTRGVYIHQGKKYVVK